MKYQVLIHMTHTNYSSPGWPDDKAHYNYVAKIEMLLKPT